jgi:protein-S-isoprenylcysteine O-methyltransferase Ste14
LVSLLLLAVPVFAQVRSDYRRLRRLSRPVAWLQTGYFFLYAVCSYAVLDSDLTRIQASGGLLALAVLMMAAGGMIVAFSMPFLGRRSFGGHVGGLLTSGIYRYSRNPQLVGAFLFIVGYALLWPSVSGMLWAGLWLPIAHLMVRGEEEHLRDVFGKLYTDYCAETPRYVGLSRHK